MNPCGLQSFQRILAVYLCGSIYFFPFLPCFFLQAVHTCLMAVISCCCFVVIPTPVLPGSGSSGGMTDGGCGLLSTFSR